METPLLKCLAFVRTVEKGSFTKAAEELHYAQSSVSKMIADLENDWGLTLLERGKHGVTLTAAGEQILPLVRATLQEHRFYNAFPTKWKFDRLPFRFSEKSESR